MSNRATQYGITPKGAKADTGWTAGETLANPFAGLTDFGKKTVQVSQGGGEEAPTEEEQAKTASDLLREKFGEQLGHKSTFTKAYKKDNKGNPVEVNMDELTPGELNSGNVVIYMGGKTGGTERERMAQAYIPKGDKLIPIGDPSYYKGEHPDARNVANALKFASIATLPFGGIGGLLSGTTSSIAGALGGGALGNIGANALMSGLTQGGISKLMGGDFSKGFKSGAVSGGIGAGMNVLTPDMFKGLGSLATPAKSIATQALTSAALGRKFDPAAAIKGAAINYGVGQGLNAAGVDPKAFNAFMQFAGPALMQKRRPGGG